jgi:hypothetical protein
MLQFFCGAGSPASVGPISGHGALTRLLAMVVDIHDVGCRSSRGRGGEAGSSDSAGNISGRGGRTRPQAMVVDIHDVGCRSGRGRGGEAGSLDSAGNLLLSLSVGKLHAGCSIYKVACVCWQEEQS